MKHKLTSQVLIAVLMPSTPTLLLAATTLEHTSVNLRDGSFQFFPSKDVGDPLGALNLTYSSRMNSKSLFGAGWCSAIDVELRINRLAEVELQICDQILRYQEVKAAQLTATPEFEHEVKFFRGAQSDDQIELNPVGYVRRHRGEEWSFNINGELVSWNKQGELGMRRLSKKAKLTSILVAGQIVELEEGIGGLITRVSSKLPSGGVATYSLSYDGERLVRLTSVAAPTGAATTAAWNFEYDSSENMTALRNAGLGVKNWIEYDRRTDRVSAVEGRKMCPEKFAYAVNEGPVRGPSSFSPRFTAYASSTLDCKDRSELLTRIETEFIRLDDGQVLLSSFTGATKGLRKFIRFHPVLGHPVSQKAEKIEGVDPEFLPKLKLKTDLKKTTKPSNTKTRLAEKNDSGRPE